MISELLWIIQPTKPTNILCFRSRNLPQLPVQAGNMFILIPADLYSFYFEEYKSVAGIWKSGLLWEPAFKIFDP